MRSKLRNSLHKPERFFIVTRMSTDMHFNTCHVFTAVTGGFRAAYLNYMARELYYTLHMLYTTSRQFKVIYIGEGMHENIRKQ